ncbi:MAG: restriction endonuclease subunit S [Limisphaerales bacterium]
MDWGCARFGEIIKEADYGLSTPADPDGNVPILKMNSISNGKLSMGELDRVTCTEEEIERYSIRRGDILFNRTNSLALVGKTAVVETDARIVFASYLVRFRLAEFVESRFVGYWFNYSRVERRLKELATVGVSQSNINPTRLQHDLHVPIPPLSEQKQISDVLGTWDEALEDIEALISAKERRKTALMQQLLTGRRRLVPFGKTEWRKTRMSDVLCRIFRPIEWSSEAPLSLVSIRRRCGGLFRRPEMQASDYKTQDLHEVRSGDFLISKRQVVHGAWALVTPGFSGCQVSKEYAILVNTAPDTLHMPFFGWLAQLPRMIRLARVASTGVHIEKLIFDPDVFLREHIRIPSSLAEQQAIAAILDTCDEELRLLRAQRAAVDQQKRGLMQRLLTGRIRVRA